ncbi:MAG: restriction endonuclease [Cyclobacteriaceae bacterium]
MTVSEEFEKQITRIHNIIKPSDAIVTWNDHVIDPDYPKGRKRQVDITIKQENSITHIECRTHSKPQDVKWIEELIGRKISLNADIIIGVSASGFTSRAKKKAEKQNVILRELEELTDKEISQWGQQTKISIKYMIYEDIKFSVFFDKRDEKVSIQSFLDEFDHDGHLGELSRYVMEENNGVKDGNRFKIAVSKIPKPPRKVICSIGKTFLKKIDTKCKLTYKEEVINIPAVFVYDAPSYDRVEKRVKIEKPIFNNWEIVKSPWKNVIYLDFTHIEWPENYYYLGLKLENLDDSKKYDVLMKPPLNFSRIFENVKISTQYI